VAPDARIRLPFASQRVAASAANQVLRRTLRTGTRVLPSFTCPFACPPAESGRGISVPRTIGYSVSAVAPTHPGRRHTPNRQGGSHLGSEIGSRSATRPVRALLAKIIAVRRVQARPDDVAVSRPDRDDRCGLGIISGIARPLASAVCSGRGAGVEPGEELAQVGAFLLGERCQELALLFVEDGYGGLFRRAAGIGRADENARRSRGCRLRTTSPRCSRSSMSATMIPSLLGSVHANPLSRAADTVRLAVQGIGEAPTASTNPLSLGERRGLQIWLICVQRALRAAEDCEARNRRSARRASARRVTVGDSASTFTMRASPPIWAVRARRCPALASLVTGRFCVDIPSCIAAAHL